MNFINFLFLIPLAITGLICSYTDIKYGKILNKWIFPGFIYVFFLYFFIFFYSFASNQENIQCLFKMLTNGIIAFLGGYFLWYFRLWSAGDAKLFSLYAFLIPLEFYAKSYIPIFPSFNLLINLFVPLLLILMAYAFFTLIKKGYKSAVKTKKFILPEKNKIFKAGIFLLQLFLNYVFIVILVRLLLFLTDGLPFSEIIFNPFFVFILLFLIMGRLFTLKRKKKWLDFIIYGTIIIYTAFLVFNEQTQSLKNTLTVAFIFMILIGLTRQFLALYIEKQETSCTKIRDIKEGMVLVKNDVSLILNKLRERGKQELFGRVDAAGINKNQAEIIKNLFKDNREFKIKSYKTFPFAPLLFLSAAISISTQYSFFPLINRLLQYLLNLL